MIKTKNEMLSLVLITSFGNLYAEDTKMPADKTTNSDSRTAINKSIEALPNINGWTEATLSWF